ncbi:uncharacterized protein LOC128277419 [Anopheles cruzii]|uniref:uncharacterized protein LOC128277419 n=1 Tax=Anopheles cruzii TaxID=68878 RepID=UPI0022EC1EFE|nr:uncharacterized protein LOC128277419 [Anopheles cruzii]
MKCLVITEFISYDDLQFIYDNFLCLRRLEVYIDDEVSIVADDSVRFDRLEHLQELKVSDNIRIRSIHRNNVRCMTITHRPAVLDSRSGIKNCDLGWIPQKFPLLNRLILEECSVSLVAVEQLHNLLPSCRIDYDSTRF